MVYLETERLRFEEFDQNDRELVRELDSDPAVMRFISNGIPSDEKEVDRAMGIFLTYNKDYDHHFGYWKAILKDSSEFIGWFHFRPLKSDPKDLKNIEIGYRLRQKFWGKGYATEGTKALIENGKTHFDIDMFWAAAMLGNKASTHVMEKCGLRFVKNDVYEDWPGADKTFAWYALNNQNKG